MNLEFSQQIIKKYANTKVHENPSCGSIVVPCGQPDGEKDGWTDKYDKDNSRFDNFSNAPKAA
jgi:hypothetical protein